MNDGGPAFPCDEHGILLVDRDKRIAELEAINISQRESLARFMISNSFATGHGDNVDELLMELAFQIKELRDAMLAERQKVKT